VPDFSWAGLVGTLETYKGKVKVTFARGASLSDPSGLFNASVEGATRGAVDVQGGDVLGAPSSRWCARGGRRQPVLSLPTDACR
jgi:hypothetical protein